MAVRAGGGPLGPILDRTTDVSASAAQATSAPSGPPIESRPAATNGPANALMHSQYEIHRLPVVSSRLVRTTLGSSTAPVGRSVLTAPRATTVAATTSTTGSPAAAAAAAMPYPAACTARPRRRTTCGRSSFVTTAAIGAPTSVGARIATDAKPVDRAPPRSKA